MSNAALFWENHAKPYFDARHLEKRLDKRKEGGRTFFKKVPFFIKHASFHKKVPFLANIKAALNL